MESLKIGFIYPKNISEKVKSNIYSNNLPEYYIESESFLTENGKKITQTISESKDRFIKTTTIQKIDEKGKYVLSNEYKNVQSLSKNGCFISSRLVNNILVDGYEFKPNAKLYTNKYTKGIKGFIQKLFWSIANDKNGCERKYLKNISGKVIEKLMR